MAAPMSNRRGACFLSSAVGLLYAVLMVSVSEAKTFQYGDISWRTCRNVDMPYQAFYDPLFPDVCKECDSPLCIGVTINVAFKTTGDGVQSAFLENLDEDVAAYTASEGAQRQLRLVRNLPSGQDVETSELRIGYREGTGDLSIVPGSAAPDKRAGIIQCSIPPCPAVSSGDVDNYVFMIDRVSDDALTVFARYSFQLQFPRNGDYTVCGSTGMRVLGLCAQTTLFLVSVSLGVFLCQVLCWHTVLTCTTKQPYFARRYTSMGAADPGF